MSDTVITTVRKKNKFVKWIQSRHVIQFIVSLILALIMFFPVYTVIIGGFKTRGQFVNDPFGLPRPFTLEAYEGILGKSGQTWIFMVNSIIIVVFTILIILVFAMAAAAAVSRIKFKGSKLLFNFFVMGMLFPLTVAILPLYLQLRNFGLLGSRAGVIIAEAAFNLPMSIFIFTGFFRDIPMELQDACEIDGGGIFTFIGKIVLPISTPVVATVSIITFIMSWNQFLLPLLVLDNSKLFTVPLGIMQFQGQFTTGWNLIMAFITVAMLPIAIFYFTMQKYVVAGLTAGAVKG